MLDFKKLYEEKIISQLQKYFNCNIMQVPRVSKITLNMGVGEVINDKKVLEYAISDMKKIACQSPVITFARKSIAGFKIREGMEMGCKVTLRKKMMYNFLQKLVEVAIPRIRDFRGLSLKSFDGFGNYSLGVREQIIFPEIDYDLIDMVRGFDINITTSAKSDKEGFFLLKSFGFPFNQDVWPDNT